MGKRRKRSGVNAVDEEYVADSANVDDLDDPEAGVRSDDNGEGSGLEGGFDAEATTPKAKRRLGRPPGYVPGSGIERQWRGDPADKAAGAVRGALAAGHPVCSPPVTGDLAHAIALQTGASAHLEQKPSAAALTLSPGETLRAQGSLTLTGHPGEITVQTLDLRGAASPYLPSALPASAPAGGSAHQPSAIAPTGSDGTPGRAAGLASFPSVMQAGNLPGANRFSQFTGRAPGER